MNPSSEKKKKIEALAAKINKRYGADTVMTAKQAASMGKLSKHIIPTPSLELNDALHCGGFCGIVELFGPNSSGKTSLAIDTIALAQKSDPDFYVGWLETEGSVTEQILMDHGVDMERVVYWRQEDTGSAENALDIARSFINDGNINAIFVNSVAGLCPKVEAEEDLEKQNIALTARLLSKFFRVATGASSKNDVTLVFINQVRDNVGQMFGDPATTTGGKALAFYASQRIRMNNNKVMAADPIKEDEGVKISCIIKKNRFSGAKNPFTKCTYYATFENGIDSIVPMPAMLLEAGIMRTKGSWWYYEDENGNLITLDGIEGKFNSKGAFLELLRRNKVWYNTMLNKLTGNMSETQTVYEIAETEAEMAEINKTMHAVQYEEACDELEESLTEN